MADDFFVKKKKAPICSCKAHKRVYEENKIKFEYTYNEFYSNRENVSTVDILVLFEFKESDKKYNLIKNFCNKHFKDYTFIMMNALGCTPHNFGAEDTIVTYKHCKDAHIKKNIEKYSPKVILTIGRAIYTITESKDLKPEHFFVPIGNICKEYEEDDSWFYTPEFKSYVFPIPALYQWVTNEGHLKDVYEYKFVLDQVNRILKQLQSRRKRIEEIKCHIVEDTTSLLTRIINDESIKAVAIDTESSGLNYFKDELYSIQFAYNRTEGFFCLWKDIDKTLLRELFNKKYIVMQNALHDVCFMKANETKVNILKANGIENAKCDFDTMLASHSLNENSPQGLKPNCWIYTYYGGYEEELKRYMKVNNISDFTKIPSNILVKYAAYDPVITYQLYEYQKDRLEREDVDVKNNFYNYVMPAVEMIIDMQMEGVPVDMKYLYEYNDKLHKELEITQKRIFEIAGREFNIRSNKELSIVMRKLPNFEVLTNDKGEELVAKNGDLILNKATLFLYDKNGIEIASLIKKANHISKEISQLGIGQNEEEISSSKNILFDIDVDDEEETEEGYMQSLIGNKLYGAYKLHGTDTGRAASGADKEQVDSVKISKKDSFGINFQNIPAKEDFRKMFLVPEGYVLGNADYDSMEVTIYSQASGKGILEDIVKSGKDFHTYTLIAIMKTLKFEGMFKFYKKYIDDLPLKTDKEIKEYLSQFDFENISYDETVHTLKVKEDKFFYIMRNKVAKVVNFQALYGATGYGFARQLEIEKEMGEQILDSFMNMYPEIKVYIKRQNDFAKENGYVKTLLGRKRRLPQLTYIGQDSYKNFQSSFSLQNLLNNSFNNPIQGTSGQVTLIAMTNIRKELKEKNMKSKLIINVHDELVMIVWIPEKDEVKKIVEKWMTYPYYDVTNGNTLTLCAEFEIGEVWKKCKSYSYWENNKEEYNSMIENINRRNKENEEFMNKIGV